MPNPIPVYLIREEHANFTRVKAVNQSGQEIDWYTTHPDDPEDCHKLYYMEQNLRMRGFVINPPKRERVIK